MKKYDYFGVPTQVKFWDYMGEHYLGGIAYRDGIIGISDIYEFAPDTLEEDPIVVYDNWVDLSSEICGR